MTDDLKEVSASLAHRCISTKSRGRVAGINRPLATGLRYGQVSNRRRALMIRIHAAYTLCPPTLDFCKDRKVRGVYPSALALFQLSSQAAYKCSTRTETFLFNSYIFIITYFFKYVNSRSFLQFV